MSSKRVSKEQQVGDLIVSIQSDPVSVGPLPPHRSNKISHLYERYFGMLSEDIEEVFLVGDGDYGNDPSTIDEMMFDINFEKWLDTMKSEIDSMHLNQV